MFLLHQAESIYIHIPFCNTKCPYCDFASWAEKENLIDVYFNALESEIKSKCEAYLALGKFKEIKTIFIGGGTPSLIHPEKYKSLFSCLKKHFTFSPSVEISLELNPGTANINFLKEYKELGINRISVGAQSFDDEVLKTLGRNHFKSDIFSAVEKILSSGINNFNLDLIYAIPNQSKKSFEESVISALSLNPKHISAYALSVEPNTPYEKKYKGLDLSDTAYEMYLFLCKTLSENKFIHYEISNFAKEGFECKHNLTYWENKEYFAFGNSAHRNLKKLRTCNVRNLNEYILNYNKEIIHSFNDDILFDEVMLKSRLKDGFEIKLLSEITKKSKNEWEDILNTMKNEGFLKINDEKIRLTDTGMYLNNEILLKLF